MYRHTVAPNCKNPPKIRFLKILKLTDHSKACNSLTYFEYKTHPPETEIYVILLKSARKNSWNYIKWAHFLAGFCHLEPLCAALPSFSVRRAYAVPQRGCLCEAPRLRRAMMRLPVPRSRRARWCWLPSFSCAALMPCHSAAACVKCRAYAVPSCDCLCRGYAAPGGAGCTYYAWTSGAMYSLCRSG